MLFFQKIWKLINALFHLFIQLLKSSLFAILFFLLFAFGKYVTSFGLVLGDFMFISVILIQIILIASKYETRTECKVILLYHLLGFAMEAFKTHPSIWSRSYQYLGFFTLLNVPLYSGFMYSAIGSFLFQSIHRLKLRFTHFPSFSLAIPIVVLIYINFFSHHFVPDIRYLLFIAVVLVAYKTYCYFELQGEVYRMHALLSVFLASLCIWIAENIATFLWARVYPNQQLWRHLVSFHKIGSWFLLFILSTVIVTYVMRKEIEYNKNS